MTLPVRRPGLVEPYLVPNFRIADDPGVEQVTLLCAVTHGYPAKSQDSGVCVKRPNYRRTSSSAGEERVFGARVGPVSIDGWQMRTGIPRLGFRDTSLREIVEGQPLHRSSCAFPRMSAIRP